MMSDDVRRVCGAKDQPIGGYDSIWDAVDGTHALMPWEDYERLRAEVDEAYQRSAMFAKRIEELSQLVRDCEQSLAERDSRIEELEQTLENMLHGRREFINHFKEKPVLITHEQIDAAWKMVRGWRYEGGTTGEDLRLWMFIFKRLGIVECEECGGSGEVKSETAPCHIGCPACNGHGWVIK